MRTRHHILFIEDDEARSRRRGMATHSKTQNAVQRLRRLARRRREAELKNARLGATDKRQPSRRV